MVQRRGNGHRVERRSGAREAGSGGEGSAGGEASPLSDVALAVAALEAALEHIPLPAFLVAPDGRILLCNGAGEALRSAGGHVDAALQQTLRGDPGVLFARYPIEVHGQPDHHLVVLRATPSARQDRARVAALAWGLTKRQSEVLRELAAGRTNRQIAAALGCAVSTVELHVTAILEKSGCDTRAEVVARLWSGS